MVYSNKGRDHVRFCFCFSTVAGVFTLCLALCFAPFSSALRKDGWLGGRIRGAAGEWSPPDTRRLGGLCIGIRLVMMLCWPGERRRKIALHYLHARQKAAHALGIRISLFLRKHLYHSHSHLDQTRLHKLVYLISLLYIYEAPLLALD